jgi:hypothetical protein
MYYDEKDMKLWDVTYRDVNGNRHVVRYCTVSKSDAIRLFKSEQERGDVFEGITEHQERKNVNE